MSRVSVSQAHALPTAEVRRRIDARSTDLATRYGLAIAWTSASEATLKRSGVTGTVKLLPSRVQVDLDLAFPVSLARGKVETKLRQQLAAALAAGEGGGASKPSPPQAPASAPSPTPAPKGFDMPAADGLEQTRRDRILIDGDNTRNNEANRLIFAGPGSLVLNPADGPKTEPQQRDLNQALDLTAKLGDEEMKLLVASQKAMAARVPELLRRQGAEDAWVKRLANGVAYDRAVGTRDELLDAYMAYWRVAATGTIALCTTLARRLLQQGAVPANLASSLDRLDAYWRGGTSSGGGVEEMLRTAIDLEVVGEHTDPRKQADFWGSARALWDKTPEWGKAGVVAGVGLLLLSMVTSLLPRPRT